MRQVRSTEEINHGIPLEPGVVRLALNEILHSVPFRTSKQCQDMLQYVVEHSLKHEQESLRERVIGTEVFGRSHTYNTSEDPVVRVRAADIRKRLAQYYQSAAHGETYVRIEIPPGSYRAVFEVIQQGAPPKPAATEVAPPVATLHPTAVETALASGVSAVESNKLRFPRRLLWLAAMLVLGPSLIWLAARPVNAIDLFWGPVMNNSKPVLIYTGTNVAYRFSLEFLENYREQHHLEDNGPELFPDLPPGQTIHARDLIPARNSFIAPGDAEAVARLVALLTTHRKLFELRYGADITVGDLHDSPTVLIGAFNNSWTLNLTSPLRFTFKQGDRVEDTFDKTRAWHVVVLSNGTTIDDYAVISRLVNSQTGAVVITVAGIGAFGTEAAGEFSTSPQRLKELLSSAPQGWEKKNMQVVLHAKVRNDTLDSVAVVAANYW
jgi:hypothetical protein